MRAIEMASHKEHCLRAIEKLATKDLEKAALATNEQSVLVSDATKRTSIVMGALN